MRFFLERRGLIATIQTAIRVHDAITAPLRNMQKAMTVVINEFERMQKVSSNAVNTSAIQQARGYINQVSTEIHRVENDIKQATNNQRKFNVELRNGGNVAAGLESKLKNIAAAYIGVRSAKSIMGLADTMTTTKARLDLMNDGLQTTAELQDKIMKSANRSRASYQTTADAVSKMGLMASDAFSSNDELIQFSELINKQFTIAGTTAEGIDAAMLQLTQAMGSGVLRGEEFNSVFEQAPTIMQSIANYLNVPIGALRDMAKEGKITAETVKNAMLASADDINGKFNSMPMTFAQIWELAKNAMLSAFRPVITFIGQAAQWIYDNWSVIAPIFYGVAAAVLVYAAALAIQTIATKLADLAAQGFFKTLLTNPMFWVAIAIGIVIAALYQWVKACGGIKAAWLTMCNWVLTAWDWVKIGVMIGVYYIMDWWDQLVKSTKWLGMQIQNICGDMKAGVLKIIEGMCNGAIDIINAFIAALNWIPGVSIDFIEHVTFGTTAQMENDAAKLARESDYANYKADIAKASQDRWNQIDQWKSEAIANQQMREAEIAAVKAEANKAAENSSPYSGELGDVAANTGNIADSTAGIKDSLEITQEDLQYLRDLAEQEVINRFTTTEIKIDMTNHNNISSEMDIDGVVDHLEEKLYEVMVSTAEGVH